MNARPTLASRFRSLGQRLQIKVQSTVHQYVEKVQKMDLQQQKKLLFAILGIGIANLALSLFSIYTLASVGIVLLAIVLLTKLAHAQIKKNGLIAYIPPKFHKILLERSLFDVICDIWFVPKLSLYIKALISPFIVKIEPSEAVHQFDVFPPGARKAILTKGLANIMPGFVRNNIYPHNSETVTDDSCNASFLEEAEDQHQHHQENREVIIKGVETMKNSEGSQEVESVENSSNKSTCAQSPLKANESVIPSGFLNTSTDEDSLINHRFNFNRQTRGNMNSQSRSKDAKPKRAKGKTPPKFERRFLHDSENDLASEVLNSNNLKTNPIVSTNVVATTNKETSAKKKSPKVFISETWDQLELFTKMHREKLLKQKLIAHLPTKMTEFKGPLQAVQKLAMLMNKEALLNKLESKKLTTVFVISSLALVLQFSISKKTRYWMYNTLHILFYIAGITLSTGSMAALAIKMKAKYKKWKEIEAAKKLKEIAQHPETTSIESQ